MMRRTSSWDANVAEDLTTASGALGSKRKGGHGRTASDSGVVASDRPSRIGPTEEDLTPTALIRSPGTKPSKAKHVRSVSSPLCYSLAPLSECILLGKETDTRTISKLLSSLSTLTPPSRLTCTCPAPSTRLLHPSILLTPLAIVLEALVTERAILRDSPATPPALPVLRDGSSLQLEDGELDWRSTEKYILVVGHYLSTILPFLQQHEDKEAVHKLVQSLRTYVGKMKKVFGEVAGMYVEGYGFVRGWWDESGMKGAAGEVGVWGDHFDA